jgi:hypothetical protein
MITINIFSVCLYGASINQQIENNLFSIKVIEYKNNWRKICSLFFQMKKGAFRAPSLSIYYVTALLTSALGHPNQKSNNF